MTAFPIAAHQRSYLWVDRLRIVGGPDGFNGVADSQQHGLLHAFADPTEKIDITLHVSLLQNASVKTPLHFV